MTPAEYETYRAWEDAQVRGLARSLAFDRRMATGHEQAIRVHVDALIEGYGEERTRKFIAHLAGNFGIFEATADDLDRAAFVREHAAFHARKRRR